MALMPLSLLKTTLFPLLKQTICYQLTHRVRREIIFHLCLLTTYGASRDQRLKQTHSVKSTKAFHWLRQCNKKKTQSVESFKRKLLPQDFIFATCRRSVNIWTQTTCWPEAALLKMSESLTGSLMERSNAAPSRISCWFICMNLPTGVIFLSVFIKEPMNMFSSWQYRCLLCQHVSTTCVWRFSVCKSSQRLIIMNMF